MKASLLDLDGVIFDTETQYTEFWRQESRKYHPEIPDLEYRIKGQTLTQIFDGYFADVVSEQPAIVERLNAFERNMKFEYVPGFREAFAKLKAAGHGTAIVTSSNKPKMEALYRHHPEVLEMFDAILTSEDFEFSKPHPDCFLKAAARLGVDAKDCLIFEDSFNGLKSARAAGGYVIGLATTNPVESISPLADKVITDFRGFSPENI